MFSRFGTVTDGRTDTRRPRYSIATRDKNLRHVVTNIHYIIFPADLHAVGCLGAH